MQKPTTLRVLRILAGNTLADESRETQIPKTALAEAEQCGAISDRTKRLLARRYPQYSLDRLLQRISPGALHVPKVPARV